LSGKKLLDQYILYLSKKEIDLQIYFNMKTTLNS
jgi:hypothetical protein